MAEMVKAGPTGQAWQAVSQGAQQKQQLATGRQEQGTVAGCDAQEVGSWLEQATAAGQQVGLGLSWQVAAMAEMAVGWVAPVGQGVALAQREQQVVEQAAAAQG